MMRRAWSVGVSLVAVLSGALLAAGCGGDGDDDVPADAVAVINGQVITKASFDEVIARAKAHLPSGGPRVFAATRALRAQTERRILVRHQQERIRAHAQRAAAARGLQRGVARGDEHDEVRPRRAERHLEQLRLALAGGHGLDAPAGKHGFVTAKPDGHFYFSDGQRARFFGTT